jgi:hypothetical protein
MHLYLCKQALCTSLGDNLYHTTACTACPTMYCLPTMYYLYCLLCTACPPLQALCTSLGDTMKATCESYVDIYAPTVFVALQTYLQVGVNQGGST